MAGDEVGDWLRSLKLESYLDTFRERGIDSTEKLATLSSTDLDDMGVTLQGHRNRILKHLPQPAGDAAQADTGGATDSGGVDDFGLNDILGDLNDMLGDLETTPETDEKQKFKSVLAESQDADLDNLLSDLCSFGEEDTEAVTERFPAQAPPPRLVKMTPVNEQAPAEGDAAPSASAVPPAQASEGAAPPVVRRNKPSHMGNVQDHLEMFSKRMSATGKISQQDLDNLMKEEKIRIAMEKLASAQMQKIIIKVFLEDKTSKTIPVATPETAFEVCRKLVVKNRMDDDPNWKLVEVCPELNIERHLEDHEPVAEAYNAWPPTSTYYFEMRKDADKYSLFVKPDKYFPTQFFEDLEEVEATSTRAGRAKRVLLQEYFSTTKRLPDVKGYVHEREGAKKWKKRFCILRASGIYYSTKGESEASRDLLALIKFDEYDMCLGLDMAAQYKAPTDFCLCFRPKIRKRVFEPADIKALACPDETSFNSWHAGVRLALHGPKLKEGYDETLRKFDALVQMGASKPETAESLKNKDLKRDNVVQANKHLIRQWQTQRSAADAPGISAATGVEFDDMGEEGATDERGIPPELQKYSWFHGSIARQESEALFARMNYITGCFLVRASTSHPGDFVLSVCVGGQPQHYHVRQFDCDDGQKRVGIDETTLFDTLPQLVDSYKQHPGRLPSNLIAEVPRQRSSNR